MEPSKTGSGGDIGAALTIVTNLEAQIVADHHGTHPCVCRVGMPSHVGERLSGHEPGCRLHPVREPSQVASFDADRDRGALRE